MAPLTRLFVGDWNGRMQGQGPGRISYYMGQELAGIRPFRCALIYELISRHQYLIFGEY